MCEGENKDLGCVFMLPISSDVRTFKASLTVSVWSYRLDDLDDEDKLPEITP